MQVTLFFGTIITLGIGKVHKLIFNTYKLIKGPVRVILSDNSYYTSTTEEALV